MESMLARTTPRLARWWDRVSMLRDPGILDFLRPYVPNSAGSERQLRAQACRGVQPVLHSLISASELDLVDSGTAAPQVVEDLRAAADAWPVDSLHAVALGELFTRHGSDKASVHGYEYLYAELLRRNSENRAVVEIGIGTTNTQMLSHMGPQGSPGASLRAFREFNPELPLVGADCDPEALRMARILDRSQGKGIEYQFVDQLEASSLARLFQATEELSPFLVIDDGLHSPEANLNVLVTWQRSSTAPWLVIEDIPAATLPIWELTRRLLQTGYRLRLFRAKRDHLALIERLSLSAGKTDTKCPAED